MVKKDVNPVVKSVLELGPVAAFFVGYLLLRDQNFVINGTDYDGFIVVTAAFIPLILASTAALWALSGHISVMQIVTAVLVLVFGGLSVWLNDERFFKMKPTLIYLLFAAILGVGLLRGQSYFKHVMDGVIPLTETGWMILTRRLVLFFLALALANELVWRTMSTDAWVKFKTFGLTFAVLGFFMTQGKLMRDHSDEDAPGDSAGDDGPGT